MSGRLFTVDRPDEQQDVSMEIPHGCPIGLALYNHIPDVDMLFFPVGTWGADMPSGTPFIVQSSEPCGACGKVIRAWFQWRRKLIFV